MDQLTSIKPDNKSRLLLVGALVIIGIVFAINMFKFPFYESDEGTYMSQAWSLIKLGQISPYQYTYDHSPLGWGFIALWSLLTGGFYTFGFSINSGRVLMLVIHLITTLLLYLIINRITDNRKIALLSVLIYGFSPLTIYYGRRVLLDNIMVVWLTASIYSFINNPTKKLNLLLSALFFGIAVLTKESAVVFFPAFVYGVYLLNKNGQSVRSSVGMWVATSILIMLLYPLFALLRGELFTSASTGVGLIMGIQTQLGRGSYNIFDLSNNTFLQLLQLWFVTDPVFTSIGILSLIISLFIGIKNKEARIISLLGLSYLLFLGRGGLVIEFYVIPLLIFFTLSIASVLKSIARPGKVFIYSISLLCAVYLLTSVFYFSQNIKDGHSLFLSDQTTPQKDAITWIEQHTPLNARGISDNYGYIELHDLPINSSRHIEYYWKAERDPHVQADIFNNDPSQVTYVASSPTMEADALTTSALPFVKQAWQNTVSVIRFENDGWYIDIREQKQFAQLLRH